MAQNNNIMICYICGKEITNLQIFLFRRGHCMLGDYHKKCARENSNDTKDQINDGELKN